MSDLKEIMLYINNFNEHSKHEKCDCKGDHSHIEESDNENSNSENYEKQSKRNENSVQSYDDEDFAKCGEDCLGEDCECCRDTEDDDEDEDPIETDANIDKKKCWKCGNQQHIRNFISLINGTETKTCLTCRDVRNSKTTALQESYAKLKRDMPPCVTCGDSDITHLEFNHINPTTKRGQVCNMPTVASQLEERQGCDSRCKKCHIIHTIFQRPPKIAWTNPIQQERARLAREFVNNYKISLGGCQNPKCKDKFDKNVLAFYEFHHKDWREKLYNIAKMLSGGWSIAAIKRELEKCILLCSYCHKIETMAEWARRREYFTSLDRPLIKRKKKRIN